MRFAWIGQLGVLVAALVFATDASSDDKRIALLIGNQSYDPTVGILQNPFNDIRIVEEALAKQGFEVLPPIKDGRRSAILGAVRQMRDRLNIAGAGAIGFLYYSGHGAAESDTNVNYLIPVDAKDPGSSTFWDESLKLDDVLKLLDGANNAAKFVVFDACRNELRAPTKSTNKGLVPVAEQQGMFIAYASAPGRTASDKGATSGPYAAALAAELAKPGLDHLNLFQNVKEAVLAATNGIQQPWESNGLGRRVYLTGPAPEPVDASSSTAAMVARPIVRVPNIHSIRDCADCPLMIVISAGQMMLGSPKSENGRARDESQSLFNLSKSIAVGQLPVTVEQWLACYSEKHCTELPARIRAEASQPVTYVSWRDATRYAEWLSGRTDHRYRLPTSDEREYFARGGNANAFWWGPDFDPRFAGRDPSVQRSSDVLSAPPGNTYGIQGLTGGVLEWTQDCWDDSTPLVVTMLSIVNPTGCQFRIVRGASASSKNWQTFRSAWKNGARSVARTGIIGFRVVREME